MVETPQVFLGRLSGNISKVYSNGAVFVAIKDDGSVFSWGSCLGGAQKPFPDLRGI